MNWYKNKTGIPVLFLYHLSFKKEFINMGLNFNHSIKNRDPEKGHISLLQIFSKRPVYFLVLSTLAAYSNQRGRCWPSVDTIANQACNDNQNIAIEAKKWLLKHQAIALVPPQKRVGAELDLDPRQHVYQLTGYFISDDGYIYEYSYMNDSDWIEIASALKDIGVPSIEEKRKELIDYAQKKAEAGDMPEQDKKSRSKAIKEKIKRTEAAIKKDNQKTTKIENKKDELLFNGGTLIDVYSDIDKDNDSDIEIVHDDMNNEKTVHTVMNHDDMNLRYNNIKVKKNKSAISENADLDEMQEAFDTAAQDDVSIETSLNEFDYQEGLISQHNPDEIQQIKAKIRKDLKQKLLEIRHFMMTNWSELSEAYGVCTKFSKQLLGISPKEDNEHYNHRLLNPMTLEELQQFKTWWFAHKRNSQTGKPELFPKSPSYLEMCVSEFRNYVKINDRKPKMIFVEDAIDDSQWM